MKKKIITLLMVIAIAGAISGCGKKDYSFTQEEWDTNDLSFIESTPDPNEANKFVGYFAERYNPYQARYYQAGENNFKEDGIQVAAPDIGRYVSFQYYIMENKENAKEFYDSETKGISDDNKKKLKYGDEAVLSLTNDGTPQKYYIIHNR